VTPQLCLSLPKPLYQNAFTSSRTQLIQLFSFHCCDKSGPPHRVPLRILAAVIRPCIHTSVSRCQVRVQTLGNADRNHIDSIWSSQMTYRCCRTEFSVLKTKSGAQLIEDDEITSHPRPSLKPSEAHEMATNRGFLGRNSSSILPGALKSAKSVRKTRNTPEIPVSAQPSRPTPL